MRTIQKHKVMVFCGLIVILSAAWICASDYSSEKTKEHTYIVGPQKSDMQRMIEAYEKLSSQYLTVVQQNLTLMASQDQQILTKLQSMENKIDALTAEVKELKNSKR